MKSIYNLEGNWRFQLDSLDQCMEEAWYTKTLAENSVKIPGTTASNKVGNPVTISTELTKESVRCLREEYKYLGAACYQRDFQLDESFEQKRIQLFLERVMFESSVWIDEQYVGKQDSLSTPHSFDITPFVKVGKLHTLTIRVDNRDIHNIGPYPSAYTDETQTIWNGIVGRVEIQGVDKIGIDHVMIGLKAKERQLQLTFDTYDLPSGITCQLDAVIKDGEKAVTSYSTPLLTSTKDERLAVEFELVEAVKYWDEFSPKLYQLELTLSYLDKEHIISGSWSSIVGFKEISTNGSHIYINGVQRFLRGNLDCCNFPLTAHPPMDYASWLKVCEATKEYGLNHIRFHSWCPPEAAFQAADATGLYLQVEGPVWMDHWTGYTVGCYEEHRTYLPAEAMRIIQSYSHHPSFCIYCHGNELNGDFTLLEHMTMELKEKNPHLLYTFSSNWDRNLTPVEDVFVTQAVDGIGCRGQYYLDQMVEGTQLSYDNAVNQRDIPVISHEVGQYVVYPNVEEIPKFTGVLKPVNYESIKQDLVKKLLASYVPDYVRASGKLSALLYKAELESALRTEKLAGIQLLGLQDFPGQSTATIGLLDCFYDSKGIIPSEEFRSFCNSTVLLAVMPKYQYTNKEEFELELQIAHYVNEELQQLEVEITLENTVTKDTFWATSIHLEKLTIGLNKGLLHLKDNIFTNLKGRNAFCLRVQIKALKLWNTWDLWVYEEEEEKITFTNSYEGLTEEVMEKLAAGEKVILFPRAEAVQQASPGKFFPVFWSPVHFTSIDPCGMIINKDHPLFQRFYPVKDYADIEWKNLLENSFSIQLDPLTSFEPITMPVPNFFNNHKVTNLLEAKVMQGKLLVCTLDFSKAGEYPEMMHFKKALRDYYESEDFNPSQAIDQTELYRVLKDYDPNTANDQQNNLTAGNTSRRNVALHKPAFADSESAAEYGASNGNDGNPESYWRAADQTIGHYWMVDLEEEYDIKETKVNFIEEGNILYVIHTSLDGKEWTLAVNKTGQTKKDQVRNDYFQAKARFVRITYNGLPVAVHAGHREFEVYC